MTARHYNDPFDKLSRWARLAWVPIPVLLLAMAMMWVEANPDVHESLFIVVLMNTLFTGVASASVVLLTGRGFLMSGSPSMLMLGCGSLLWSCTALVSSTLLFKDKNAAVTLHNLGILGAAGCHLVGISWRKNLLRPDRWLVVGYGAVLLLIPLIFYAAVSGSLPVFFVQGEGGTPIRQTVLLVAAGTFVWVASRMMYLFWKGDCRFCYWYGLGLALVATALIGFMMQANQGSMLNWLALSTQWLGAAYLVAAAFNSATDEGGWKSWLKAFEHLLHESATEQTARSQPPGYTAMRYGIALLAIVIAWALRLLITSWWGPGLPLYLTFFPALMIAALLAGLVPSLVAAAIAAVSIALWSLPPLGSLEVHEPIHRASLVFFMLSSSLTSLTAELYRRSKSKALAYDRERILSEAQSRLAVFGLATFEGIVETKAGRIDDCNEQFARIIGRPVPELKGAEFSKLIPPEPKSRTITADAVGDEMVTEHTVVRDDGSIVIVEVHARPVAPDSDRQLIAIRDITANRKARAELIESRSAALNLMEDAIISREQAERSASELQESEERFRNMFESHYAVKFMIDPECGTITDANPAAARFYGYTREELRAMRVQDINLVAPEEVAMNTRKAAAGKQHYFITQHRLANGEPRWVEEYIAPVDVHGRVMLFSIIHDITDRREAEAALVESDYRMRLATSATGVGIWEWHIASNQLKWNDQMFRIYGVTPTADHMVSYQTWAEAVLPEDLPQQEASLRETIRRGGKNSRDFRITRRDDGKVRYIQSVDAVRLNSEGNAEWVVGTNLDITARKSYEAEIYQLNAGLEQRVHERTSQLVAANKELEAFSYSVSHDLRAPLRAVLGFARLFEQSYGQGLDQEGHRLLGVVITEATRMGCLIDDLLAFSRMGRRHVEHATVNMTELAQAEFDRLTRDPRDPAPQFVLHPLPPTKGDPVLLGQVFANLLSNAIKFSKPKEDARVEIGSTTNGDEVEYFVRDNGVGFDQKYSHKLFGVFQRLHNVNEFEGTGIGLALVQRIIQRHGGHIRAESQLGLGTTFYFSIPEVPIDDDLPAITSSSPPSLPNL